MVSKKFLVNINLGGNVIENFAVQGLSTAPTSVVNGGLYYNTNDKRLYMGVNGSWIKIPTNASELGNLEAAITAKINGLTYKNSGSHLTIANDGDGINFTITEKDIASAAALSTLDNTVNGAATSGGSNVKSWIADAVAAAKSTIDGYKVNGKAISSNPTLDGASLHANGTTGTTLNAAIADAKKAGTDAKADADKKVASVTSGSANTIAIGGTATAPTVSAKTSTVTSGGTGLTTASDVKSYVDDKVSTSISSVYRIKGSVDVYSNPGEGQTSLPTTNVTVGDVYNVKAAVGNPGDANYTPAGTNYVATEVKGTTVTWDALGGTVDLSAYAKTSTVYDKTTADSTFATNTALTSETNRATTAEAAAKKSGDDAMVEAKKKVASVASGSANTIAIGGTATAPTVSAKTSTVASNGSGLAVASDVKSYVDNAVSTNNKIAHVYSSTLTWTASDVATVKTINKTTHKCGATPIVQCYEGGSLVEVDVAVDAQGNVSITSNQAVTLTVNIVG